MGGASCLLAAVALAAGVLGAEGIPGVLQLDIHGRRGVAPALARRSQQTVEEVITNEKQRGGYFSTCTVGTPPQDVILLLDTGSSDTWIPASSAAICSKDYSDDPCPLGNCEFCVSRAYTLVAKGYLQIRSIVSFG